MAQQTKRRRTKHRGNAAGMVEQRGRTGRKPTASESKKKPTASQRRANRFDQPPSWRSAFNRALVAIVFFAFLLILIFKQPAAQAAMLSAFMLLIYIPMGYYTDMFLYKRRQRQKAEGKAK
jgi:drug/metabolite transporter (DMT)-like permease